MIVTVFVMFRFNRFKYETRGFGPGDLSLRARHAVSRMIRRRSHMPEFGNSVCLQNHRSGNASRLYIVPRRQTNGTPSTKIEPITNRLEKEEDCRNHINTTITVNSDTDLCG